MCNRARLVVAIASLTLATPALTASNEQPNLRRPVNAPEPPEISLGELASQVNPGTDATSQKHTYTNADLKLRPAPVPPTTPPFPEIAPARGILEHPGAPEIDQVQPAPQGIPFWDFPGGVGYIGGFGRQRQAFSRNRLPRPDDPFSRLGLFEPGFGLRSATLPAPIGSGRDLFTVGHGVKSFGSFSGLNRIGMQGRPTPPASPRPPSMGSPSPAPMPRPVPRAVGKPQ